MTRAADALFGLLRLSLGTECRATALSSLSQQDWVQLIDMSFDGGVAALSVDGYNCAGGSCELPDNLLESDESLENVKYEWLGSVLQAEEDYHTKMRYVSRFAKALKAKGIACLVLKGISYSTYYNNPAHREFGDCDVYLGSSWAVGNQVAVDLGGRYDFGTYKHSHLFLGSLMIENHRYLTGFNGTRQGKKTERLLEQLIASEDGTQIGKSCLLCPNDTFNAVFLIRHAYGNFMDGGLILRMVYDWAALLKRCGHRLDWNLLRGLFQECRLLPFTEVMNSMCVEYFALNCSGPLCPDGALVREIMQDTLDGGIYTKGYETFPLKCLRIARRFRRFWRYRRLATESVPRMIWNSFAFSSYLKRRIQM